MLAFVMLLWAGNSIVGRAVRNDIPPFCLALSRWSGALAFLLPIAWRRIRHDWAAVSENWGKILLLGIVGVGSFNAFLYSGLRSTTAANALLIQAGIPLLVLIFDWVLFRSRPYFAQMSGVVISAVGVMTIVFRADWALLSSLSFGSGDALVVCAVVAWSLYTALLRLRPAIHPLSFLALTFGVGAVAMLPLALAEWQTETIRWTPRLLGGVAYVAIFPSIVAYFLFNKAVAEIGAAAAGQTISLQPILGALLAVFVLGEELRFYHVVGMLLIVVGIAAPLVFQPRNAVQPDRAAPR